MPNQPIRLRRPAIVTPTAANIVIAAMRPKTSAPVFGQLAVGAGLVDTRLLTGLVLAGLLARRSGSVPSLLTRPLMALSSAARSAV